jgi:hypothetical protein
LINWNKLFGGFKKMRIELSVLAMISNIPTWSKEMHSAQGYISARQFHFTRQRNLRCWLDAGELCQSGTTVIPILERVWESTRSEIMGAFSGTPSNPSGGNGPYPNKREVPRFSLIATVVLREPDSDTKISGRISELSRKGCYVDTLITLPEGTQLEVRISRDQGVFASNGKIVYVQTGMGMGVAFLEVAADQLKTLDTWLAELSA